MDGLTGRPSDGDVSGLDPILEARAAVLRQLLLQKMI